MALRDLEQATNYLHLSWRHITAACSPLIAITIRGAEQPNLSQRHACIGHSSIRVVGDQDI
jgi:hypothetical protein